MGKADSLSRRSDWEKGGEGDNKERTLLKPEWVQSIQAGEVIVEGIDILEKIRKSEAKDDKVIKAVEEMKKAGVKMLRDEEWREEDGLMLKEEKVYVPKDKALRVEIIRLHHDTPMGGTWRTMEDGGDGHSKFLVARSNERSEEIRGGVQCLPAKQESHRTTCRKVNA